MEHEKYSYVDTLRWLAQKYNVEVEETFQSDEQRQSQLAADSLYIINQFAQQYFSNNCLKQKKAVILVSLTFKSGVSEKIS
jgi:DNA primase